MAQSIILHLRDFPPGWTSSPDKGSDSDPPELVEASTTLAQCLGVDPSLVVKDKSQARAGFDTFRNGDQQVDGSATLHDSTRKTDALVPAFRKPSSRQCFAAYLDTSFEKLAPDAGIGPAEVEHGEIGFFDGEPIQLRAVMPITAAGRDPVPLFIDFILVVKGRATASMTFQNIGGPFPEDLEADLVNKVFARMPEA